MLRAGDAGEDGSDGPAGTNGKDVEPTSHELSYCIGKIINAARGTPVAGAELTFLTGNRPGARIPP